MQCPGATKEHRLTRARGESGGGAPGTLSTQLPVGTAPQRHRGTAQGKPGNSKPGDQDNSGAWCWARRPFGSRRRPVRRGGKSATQAQVLVSLQLSGPSTKRQARRRARRGRGGGTEHQSLLRTAGPQRGPAPQTAGTCIAGCALALTAPRGAGTTRRGTPVISPLGRDLNAVPRSPERVPSPPPTFLLRSTSSRHGCQGLVAASQTVGTQGPRIKPIEFFLPGFATSPAMLTIPSLLGDMCIACL